MFTDSSQHQQNAPFKSGFFARTAERVQQFVCGLHGHDALLHFDRGRISLLCTSCGYESPGWDVKEAPTVATRERVESGAIPSMPLVRARNVA